MRVLFIAGADQQYGTYRMAKQLLETVCNQRADIDFIVITQKHGPLNDWCNNIGFKNYVFPYRYCVFHPSSNVIIGIFKRLIKYLIVTISNKMALYELEKTIVLESIDVIHTNINRDLFGMQISQKHNIPNITHLREYSRAHFGLKPIYSNQVSVMNRYSTRFVAISNAVKNDWSDYGLDINKIDVIYDGVDVKSFKLKKARTKDDKPLKIMMCGAIYEGKGQKELLEAAIELINDDFDLCVDYYGSAANDAYLSQLKTIIEKNKLHNKIRFMGFHNNLNELMCNYDVGVVCSKAEGFGLVTVEYLLSGVKVIASNTGANPELLDEGEYGLLYPLGDITALKDKIKNVYKDFKNGNDEVEKLRKYAEQRFTIQNTAKQMCEVYDSVIRKT